MEITTNELLEEIAAEMLGVELQPGDITPSMIVERVGCSGNSAREKLAKLERAGKVIYVGRHRKGDAREKVYRPVV